MLTAPNQEWSIDFASDVTASGRRLRGLSVLDSFTKQSLALEVDTSFPSRRMTRSWIRPSICTASHKRFAVTTGPS